jgi:hypothetical protein
MEPAQYFQVEPVYSHWNQNWTMEPAQYFLTVELVFLLLVQNWTMEPAQYSSHVKLVFLLLEPELDHGTSSIFFSGRSGLPPELDQKYSNQNWTMEPTIFLLNQNWTAIEPARIFKLHQNWFQELPAIFRFKLCSSVV